MPSIHSTGPEDRKASSLTDSASAKPAPASVSDIEHMSKAMRAPRRDMARIRAVILDIVLLVVLIGVIVGGYFGYHALRQLYAPVWDIRDIVFCVEMENIALDMVKYNDDGKLTLHKQKLWSSDRTDADYLGDVEEVSTVLITHADGTQTLTLYLTVKAKADYLEGYGYRMGATMLLAGTESVFRLRDLSAEATIISLREVNDTTPPETDDDFVVSAGQFPRAGQ